MLALGPCQSKGDSGLRGAGVTPVEWTAEGLRLTARVVAPFVVDWRQIVESGVAAMGVVPALDELEQRHARRGLSVETAAVEQLAFERGEKALAHGIVEAITDRAHRGSHASLPAAHSEGDRRLLCAWSE